MTNPEAGLRADYPLCLQKALEHGKCTGGQLCGCHDCGSHETIRHDQSRSSADKDMVTDVLSFPMLEFLQRRAAGGCGHVTAIRRTDSLFLGDMILNYERAC